MYFEGFGYSVIPVPLIHLCNFPLPYQLVLLSAMYTNYLYNWLHILANFIYAISQVFRCYDSGELVRKLYKLKKRVNAVVKIQKTARKRLARKDYIKILFSSVVLQTSLRAMVARDELRYRVKVAIIIQVITQLLVLLT